ncbi:ArsR family transcriptional regulator [Ornithinimicrobium sufpigmenti]|uniref:ArsR family transcriptional regulator n=1 Tax=Ornithinimicrobium sufpigmenti TaxID=2508882 RepID=UPI003CE49614
MLADPTRLMILWVLLRREANVTTMSQLVDAAPSAISQHLNQTAPGRPRLQPPRSAASSPRPPPTPSTSPAR